MKTKDYGPNPDKDSSKSSTIVGGNLVRRRPHLQAGLGGIFSFEGRIGLEEYWGNMAVSVIIGFGISLMSDTGAACFAFLLIPCFLWYVVAFMSKRCHDLGNPGSYILIPYYPLVLAFGAGDAGENEYGPNPDKGSA